VIPNGQHRPAGVAAVSNAARLEEKHFVVPQHKLPAEALIGKPMKPLEIAAREGIQICCKTLRHSDCVEVGKDHFDEFVSRFLSKIGETNIVAVHPITYSHQDLATRAWIADYGLMVIYRS
jgi:hypothetical protein